MAEDAPSTRDTARAVSRHPAVNRQAMEQTLGELVLDEQFRSVFFADPAVATRCAGIDLGEHEREQLTLIRPGALAAFKRYLDQKGRLALDGN
jgi:hypothetical protein